jgi:YjjG family noncanonical pyrimidine nucleotidase
MDTYKWIVFDADGTLFDYDRSELAALAHTFGTYNLDFDANVHRAYREINGRLWKAFENGAIASEKLRVQRFEELSAALGLNFNPAQFSTDYLNSLGDQCHLLPGAHDLIRHLARDIRLALATNGIGGVQRTRIAASSIGHFFEALAISEEIGVAKPDPEFFRELFSRMGDPDRAEVLMVGDSLTSDIKGGAGFGIHTCWYNPGKHANPTPVEPTYEIRKLEEVIEII